MLWLAKAFAATVIALASGRASSIPTDQGVDEWIDTAIMDLECDADPECEIVVVDHDAYYGRVLIGDYATHYGAP